jgi:CubicO group peptidase (beta-lactamase class C family)
VHSERRQRLAAIFVLLILATAAARGQQTPASAPSALVFPPLEAYLEALRQQVGIPGMSAAIVHEGEVVWERGFGFQNVAARVRATPDTPYLVGDVSGTLAAVLLLQCVEQRRMHLDEPIRTYGTTLPEPGVTMRQLLSHTSGDGAGDTFKYSPDRYAQLTSAMEWCVTQPYRKTVSHRILNRLAMKDSVPGTDMQDPEIDPDGLYDPAELERYRHVLERMALPYKVDSRLRPERTEMPVAGINAATGLVSTVRDIARFDAAVDSALLLDPETLAVAWTPHAPPGRPPLPMGLGWFVQAYRGERVVWHFGLVPNAYSSLILKLPARHLTFILLANSDGLSAPFPLAAGDVTRSVFATLFLKLAIQ